MTDTELDLRGLVMAALIEERSRQDEKWGEQNHDPFTWLAILMEEAGEASKEALTARFHKHSPPGWGSAKEFRQHCLEAYKAELIQVAAVAVAAVECLERSKWDWPITKDE